MHRSRARPRRCCSRRARRRRQRSSRRSRRAITCSRRAACTGGCASGCWSGPRPGDWRSRSTTTARSTTSPRRRAALRPRLIWIETPANPTWEITDIAAASEIARETGALVAVDSTAATPLLTPPDRAGRADRHALGDQVPERPFRRDRRRAGDRERRCALAAHPLRARRRRRGPRTVRGLAAAAGNADAAPARRRRVRERAGNRGALCGSPEAVARAVSGVAHPSGITRLPRSRCAADSAA